MLLAALSVALGLFFFEIVQDRRESTLLEVIKRKIRPGTTIMSDMHRSYMHLSEHNYAHFTVNHSENFVDPRTGSHTQTIESVWGALKHFLRSVGKHLGPHIEEYIAEFLYRRAHAGRLFDKILDDIARFGSH